MKTPMPMEHIFLHLGSVAFVMSAHAQNAPHPDDIARMTVSSGVELQELIGRSAQPAVKTDRVSVAFFHLNPGRASAWSYTKVGEESFLFIKGHGEVWLGDRAHAVRPGSFILVPPGVVRSVRAGKGETLEFYAITAPAWSSDDDVMTTAPVGAPQ